MKEILLIRSPVITDWDSKFYHVYADEKRVKEISVEEARKIIQMGSRSKRKMLTVSKSWINIWHGSDHIGLDRKQLEKVLEDANNDQTTTVADSVPEL